MKHRIQALVSVIRLWALLLACLLPTLTSATPVFGSLVAARVSIAYDATVNEGSTLET
ncbi:MAG: hypothetical protein WCP06_13785 [Verrucomicrobiota bacterium]